MGFGNTFFKGVFGDTFFKGVFGDTFKKGACLHTKLTKIRQHRLR
jgi:hypothetical protein